jgi:hypothetical protein
MDKKGKRGPTAVCGAHMHGSGSGVHGLDLEVRLKELIHRTETRKIQGDFSFQDHLTGCLGLFTEAAEGAGSLRAVLLLLKDEIVKCSCYESAGGKKRPFADECTIKEHEIEQLKASSKGLEAELDDIEVLSKKLQHDLDLERQKTKALCEEIGTLKQEYFDTKKNLTYKNQELQQVKEDLTQNALSLHREVKELKAKNESSKRALQQHQMERMRSEGLRQRFEMLDKHRRDAAHTQRLSGSDYGKGTLTPMATAAQVLFDLQECLHLDYQLEVLSNARVSKFEEACTKITSVAGRKRMQDSFVDELGDIAEERSAQTNHIQHLHASLLEVVRRTEDGTLNENDRNLYQSMQRDLVPHLKTLAKQFELSDDGHDHVKQVPKDRHLKASRCGYWQDFVDIRSGNVYMRFRVMSLSELLSFLEGGPPSLSSLPPSPDFSSLTPLPPFLLPKELSRAKIQSENREFTMFQHRADHTSDANFPDPMPLLEFMYIFLKERYISTHAVLSVVGSILSSVDEFRMTNSVVNVFAKTICGEVNECLWRYMWGAARGIVDMLKKRLGQNELNLTNCAAGGTKYRFRSRLIWFGCLLPPPPSSLPHKWDLLKRTNLIVDQVPPRKF